MKEIVNELKAFLRKDFNLYAYGFTFLFLAVCTYLNYTYSFEKKWINSFFYTPWSKVVYPLYYLLPYLTVVILTLGIKKELKKLKQAEFWIKSILFFTIFGIISHLPPVYRFIDFGNISIGEYMFIHLLSFNASRLLPIILLFYFIKLIFDRKDKHLYGLGFEKMSYRPFFLMLLIMLPIIAGISFQSDFRAAYPRFRFWKYGDIFGMSSIKATVIFEIVYGLDFLTTEFMFRGALVIGMARVLGKDAILPMAAVYVILHFGKPAAEAVAAFFGGFILGVHSLAKKNIWGGFIVHAGIAFMMEIAAILQHYYG
ncbi:MAG: hypothetical protein CSB06_00555 [Bacteroidia bacterium]|nr:MAG: hypothetical protein CSB06_00555 [Bacteroidia bacterium]